MLKFNNSSGDTIVEVLIVLAVVGLTIAIAYATASAAMHSVLRAQQRSNAIQFASSQIESLRASQQSGKLVGYNTQYFCFQNSGSTANLTPTYMIQTPSQLGYISPCRINNRYNLFIECINNCTSTNPTFDVQAYWQDVSVGIDTLNINYVL